jgi:hemoglobin
MSTIPSELPPGFVAYGRSPDFFSDNLPAKLQSAHSTKAGTWGLLHVLEGVVHFHLESPHHGEKIVRAGETVVIESQVPHRVEFLEPGRMFVEFYRSADASQ